MTIKTMNFLRGGKTIGWHVQIQEGNKYTMFSLWVKNENEAIAKALKNYKREI